MAPDIGDPLSERRDLGVDGVGTAAPGADAPLHRSGRVDQGEVGVHEGLVSRGEIAGAGIADGPPFTFEPDNEPAHSFVGLSERDSTGHQRLCQIIVNATNQNDPFYVDDDTLVDALLAYARRQEPSDAK